MNYIQLTCTITSENMELAREILTQQLADDGFESFEDTPQGLSAYIPEKSYNETLRSSLPTNIMGVGNATYTASVIMDQNWNEEWEKNFQPITIADKCFIRAPFHAKNETIPFEIVIEPKMAFGTGHHETTSLMIEQMLSIDFTGKQVLDMGCGTGILAIMASKLKASHILAIDIDEWAFENTRENCFMNKVENVTITQGDVELLSEKKFDIILANINRNILLVQISSYAKALAPQGLLLMSGIYRSDFDIISQTTKDCGFANINLVEKNNWIAVLFRKN